MRQGPQEDTSGCNPAALWKLSSHHPRSCHRLMGGHLCGNLSTLSRLIVLLEPASPWPPPPLSSFSVDSYSGWPHSRRVQFPHCMSPQSPNLHLCFNDFQWRPLFLFHVGKVIPKVNYKRWLFVFWIFQVSWVTLAFLCFFWRNFSIYFISFSQSSLDSSNFKISI